ncbi:MAG: cold-shock protein [Flavobacteriia bacterium]|jgi:cold shock CspA family protein
MAKSQETFNKKEKEKLRQKKREDKLKKKEERKAGGSSSFDDMIAYVDENGNLSATPPDPTKKKKVIAANIEIGIPTREEGEAVNPIHVGIVTFFDTSKGYGFIKDRDSQESYFSHINAHLEAISERDTVQYRIEKGMKGMNAVDVKKYVKPAPVAEVEVSEEIVEEENDSEADTETTTEE